MYWLTSSAVAFDDDKVHQSCQGISALARTEGGQANRCGSYHTTKKGQTSMFTKKGF